jgi:hypothetical protein
VIKNFRAYYIFVFIFAFSIRLISGPRTIDDAYITYRYASNITSGNGFVYNQGEHVLGTTTPLFTLILTIFASLTGGPNAPFPILALIINSIADGFNAMLLLFIGRKLGQKYAGIGASLVWAVLPFSVTFAIGGLETSVYVSLLLACWAAILRQNYTLVSFLLGLALLTRPDALILILPLGLGRILLNIIKKNERIKIIELIAFLLPTLIWYSFAIMYFGSPFPHSIIAKSQAYHLPEFSSLGRLFQHYATPFMGNLTFGSTWIKVGLVLYPFLHIVGSIQILKINYDSWPFLIFPWLYLIAFALPNPLIFRWYLTPPLPFYILPILIGLERLVTDIAHYPRLKFRGHQILQNILIIGIVILSPFMLSLKDWSWIPDHGIKRPAPDMAWYKLELLYRKAADFLQPMIEKSTYTPLLAAGDVGVLGYYTHARILDTVGLNSPQTLDYYPLPEEMYAASSYVVPPDLILDYKPDIVVILEIYGRNGLLKNDRFNDEYKLFKRFPTDIYGSDGMMIFTKN